MVTKRANRLSANNMLYCDLKRTKWRACKCVFFIAVLTSVALSIRTEPRAYAIALAGTIDPPGFPNGVQPPDDPGFSEAIINTGVVYIESYVPAVSGVTGDASSGTFIHSDLHPDLSHVLILASAHGLNSTFNQGTGFPEFQDVKIGLLAANDRTTIHGLGIINPGSDPSNAFDFHDISLILTTDPVPEATEYDVATGSEFTNAIVNSPIASNILIRGTRNSKTSKTGRALINSSDDIGPLNFGLHPGPHITQPVDSGGPALYNFGTTQSPQWKIVGVNRASDQNSKFDEVRTDVHRDWIEGSFILTLNNLQPLSDNSYDLFYNFHSDQVLYLNKPDTPPETITRSTFDYTNYGHAVRGLVNNENLNFNGEDLGDGGHGNTETIPDAKVRTAFSNPYGEIWMAMNVTADGIYNGSQGVMRVAGAALVTTKLDNDGHVVVAPLPPIPFGIPQNGWLEVNGNVRNSGTINVLKDAALIVDGDISIEQNAVLGGGGYIHAAGKIRDAGTISPGASVGTMNIDGNFEFSPGSAYHLEVSSDSAQVVSTDKIVVSGNTTFAATSASPLVIALSTLDSPTGAVGAAHAFYYNRSYSIPILTSQSLTGFDANSIHIDSSQFQNGTFGGTFSVTQSAGSVLLNFTPSSASSTHRIWTKPESGSFSTASNWTPGSTPQSTETAVFDQGSASNYTVSISQSAHVSALIAATDRLTLNVSQGVTLTADTLKIGTTDLGDRGQATVTMTGPGTFQVPNTLFVGQGAGAVGYLAVDSSSVTNPSLTLVGDSGDGTLTLKNGAHWNTKGLFLGHSDFNAVGVNGKLIVDGSGTTLTISDAFSPFDIGDNNTETPGGHPHGDVLVSHGGKIQITDPTATITLGSGEGASATFEIRDAGSRVESARALWVGYFGNAQGSLTVSNGGYLLTQIGASGSGTSGLIGYLDGSTGTVLVSGSGSRWEQNGKLSVGFQSHGNLTINSGGVVQSVGGNIGRVSTSTGSVYISGTGSIWSSSDAVYVGGDAPQAGASGTLDVESSGSVNVQGLLKVWPTGHIVVGGGNITATTLEVAGGDVRGSGQITANISNSGLVAPGSSIGALQVTGTFTQSAAGILQMELGGVTNAQYDRLIVSGASSLAGSLQVILSGSFVPTGGNSFDILDLNSGLSGVFSTVSLPALPSGLSWNTSQLYTAGIISVSGPALNGDFNHNGVVDAGDYVVLRKGFGSSYTQSDYNTWRSHFGQTNGSGASLAENTAVPEPSSLALLLASFSALASRRRKPIRHNHA